MTNGSNQHIAARKIFHYVFAIPERTLFSGISGDRIGTLGTRGKSFRLGMDRKIEIAAFHRDRQRKQADYGGIVDSGF
jgi:hypothetical protein